MNGHILLQKFDLSKGRSSFFVHGINYHSSMRRQQQQQQQQQTTTNFIENWKITNYITTHVFTSMRSGCQSQNATFQVQGYSKVHVWVRIIW